MKNIHHTTRVSGYTHRSAYPTTQNDVTVNWGNGSALANLRRAIGSEVTERVDKGIHT